MAAATETAPPNVITARSPADLLDKIYSSEGWVRAEGEVRIRRANAVYTIARDNRRDRYTATRKAVSA